MTSIDQEVRDFLKEVRAQKRLMIETVSCIPVLETLRYRALVALPVSMHCRHDALKFVMQALNEHGTLQGCVNAIEQMQGSTSLAKEKFVGRLKMALSYEHPQLTSLVQMHHEHEEKFPALIELGDRQWPLLLDSTPSENKPRLFDECMQVRYNTQAFQVLYPSVLYKTLDRLFEDEPESFAKAINSIVEQGSEAKSGILRRYQQAATSRHLPQDDVRRYVVWEKHSPLLYFMEVQERFDRLINDIFGPPGMGNLPDRGVQGFISIVNSRWGSMSTEQLTDTCSGLRILSQQSFYFPLKGTQALHALIDYLESKDVFITEMVIKRLVGQEGKVPDLDTTPPSSPAVSAARRNPDQVALSVLDLLPKDPTNETQQIQRTAWLNTLFHRINTALWHKLDLDDDQLFKLYSHLGDNQYLARIQSSLKLEEALQHDLGL